jgi:hypothetical protein
MADAAGVIGLSARILGPPRDAQFLARMDPPKDQRLLRAADGNVVVSTNGIVPFEKQWQVDETSNSFYAAITERDRNLLAVAATNAMGLAFTLDRVCNNTSVVALFSYRGKHLLFPGDAQYGNWEPWIEDPKTADLLADVHFYKVAHHGSYNATPKGALDRMTDGAFVTMMSTQSVPWNSIPYPKLVQALTTKARCVVQSDSIPVDGAPTGPSLPEHHDGFEVGPFWIDYMLPV